MSEIWRNCASDTELKLYGAQFVPVSSKIAWWWLCFVVCSLLGRAAFQLTKNAKSVEDFIQSTFIALSVDLVSIAGAITAMLMLKALDKRQAKKIVEYLHLKNTDMQ